MDQVLKPTYYGPTSYQMHARKKEKVEKPLKSISSHRPWILSTHGHKDHSQQGCQEQFGMPIFF